MPSLHDRIAAARHRFQRAGIGADTAAMDAEVLARHALGWDRAQLITHAHEPPPAGFEAGFEPLVARRERREPVAMIIGHREFWNLEFEVTPDVLVPRPETELVIETAIDLARDAGPWRHIVDVGTGSGCIAIALATEFPGAAVTAADLSPAALEVARRNARRHGVADRITFVTSDLLAAVHGTADLIVSNPPYCRSGDAPGLQPEVLHYEPHAALFSGADGLEAIRRLTATAAPHLADGGRLVVEFGFGQDDEVVSVARAAGWQVIDVRHDLQQIPRVIVLGR